MSVNKADLYETVFVSVLSHDSSVVVYIVHGLPSNLEVEKTKNKACKSNVYLPKSDEFSDLPNNKVECRDYKKKVKEELEIKTAANKTAANLSTMEAQELQK